MKIREIIKEELNNKFKEYILRLLSENIIKVEADTTEIKKAFKWKNSDNYFFIFISFGGLSYNTSWFYDFLDTYSMEKKELRVILEEFFGKLTGIEIKKFV